MFRNLTTVLGLLLVVIVLWIVFSIYYSITATNINPNAQTYTTQISPQFRVEGFNKVTSRITESLMVSPDVFKSLSRD